MMSSAALLPHCTRVIRRGKPSHRWRWEHPGKLLESSFVAQPLSPAGGLDGACGKGTGSREGPPDQPVALRKIRLNKEHKPSLATADPATETEAACLATGNAQSALPGTPLHTSFTPLPAQNHSSYGGDCIRVATLLLIKISTSLDKVIIEHENLWIRTQNWKFQKEKVD